MLSVFARITLLIAVLLAALAHGAGDAWLRGGCLFLVLVLAWLAGVGDGQVFLRRRYGDALSGAT